MSSELCPVLDALNGRDVVTAPIIDRCGLWSRDKAWCSSLSTPASAMLQALHCRADWMKDVKEGLPVGMKPQRVSGEIVHNHRKSWLY